MAAKLRQRGRERQRLDAKIGSSPPGKDPEAG